MSTQLAAGRGRTTAHHAVAMPRGAVNHAMRTWRLRYNPAKHSVPAEPRAAVRLCWTPDEAAASLRPSANPRPKPAAPQRYHRDSSCMRIGRSAGLAFFGPAV
ncbi:hypothetical protein [Streptomyces sp. R44]|uniref:Transposase n=1 Tax=Streptomyces sp. R44 TaxID=3238633 RepID=A0AB39TG67_9ACTN